MADWRMNFSKHAKNGIGFEGAGGVLVLNFEKRLHKIKITQTSYAK